MENTTAPASVTAEVITAIATLIDAVAWPLLIVGLLAAAVLSKRLRTLIAHAVELLLAIIRKGGKFSILGLSIEGVPPEIANDTARAATKEGVGGAKMDDVGQELRESMERESWQGSLATYPYLMHSAMVQVARTAPLTGRYSVRVWVEFDQAFGFAPGDVKHVVYRLDETWAPGGKFISTAAAESHFELWISVYGEFTIIAAVEKKDGDVVYLSRYLDLPGRPPD